MYLTNDKLLDQMKENWLSTNQIIELFDSVLFLLKKYWKNINTKKILDIIEKESQSLFWMIIILKKTNKLYISKISILIKKLKEKNSDYDYSFDIVSNSDRYSSDSEDFLKSKFKDKKLKINKKNTEDIELKIKWEWFFYKRWLKQDIDKILSIDN